MLGAAAKENRLILRTGDHGVGITTIAAFLAVNFQVPDSKHQSPTPNLQSVGYHFCQPDNAPSLSAANFVRSLASQLCKSVPGFAQQLIESPKSLALLSESACRPIR